MDCAYVGLLDFFSIDGIMELSNSATIFQRRLPTV